jgi:hypothetical protein
MVSHKLFAQAGLEPLTFQSQPRIIGISHWHLALKDLLKTVDRLKI